jgi:hypothetical protein
MESLGNELRAREEALLDPVVRRNRAQVEALLAEEFLEFGSSGNVWSRNQIFDLLAAETYSPIAIEDFEYAQLSEDVALVSYRAVRTDSQSAQRLASLRSSIWIKKSTGWRLRFHQGTRIP